MCTSCDPVSRIPDGYHRRAAELALRAAGDTSPNPIVGCVIVSSAGDIVGEGFHERAGLPHAEANALAAAGEAARGGTAFVTLEPCAHFGRTAPCAQALIDAGVDKVVIGALDPNPKAAGGAAILRSAGIEVEVAADAIPFEELNRPWMKHVTTGLPYVVVKQGMSIDGATSADGTGRTTITGAFGREVTLGLRQRLAATLIGSATVVADDPTLLRAPGARFPGVRIILAMDSLPPTSARLLVDESAPTWIVAPYDALEEVAIDSFADHVRFVPYERSGGLEAALRAIADAGADSILVEAGPRLFASFMESAFVDELITVTAGGFIGTATGGRTMTNTLAGDTLTTPWRPLETHLHGDVVVTTWSQRVEGED